jgi:hypothetical protein
LNTKHELIQALIHQGKYNGVTDACNIIHPDKKKLIITESYVDKVRMIVDEEQINVLIPTDLDERTIEESALTDAITSGDIYDDAEKVKDQANLIRMTTMPNLALSHNDLPEANNVTTAITPVIGAMNDNGRFASEDNMKNGVNLVKDLVNTETPGDEVRRVMDNYLSNKTEDEIGVQKSPVDIAGVVNDVKNIQSVKPEDTVAVGDYDVVDVDNDDDEVDEADIENEIEEECKCEETVQEGVFSHNHKKKVAKLINKAKQVLTEIQNEGKDSDTFTRRKIVEKYGSKVSNVKSFGIGISLFSIADVKIKEHLSSPMKTLYNCAKYCDIITEKVKEGFSDSELYSLKKIKEHVGKVVDSFKDIFLDAEDFEKRKSIILKNTDEALKAMSTVNFGAGIEKPVQEGFFNRPKKLKPIPRDIIQYVNEQIRMISTSRDQAMLASYVSNKLEFVDFYITVIDTHDDRFIVHHTRDYLTNMQNDLNRLLNQILHVQPVNKYDRVWKMTYPDGYAG